ncbi:hypothetical protein [Ruegeria sp. YS9]|uniref:hypothetical protein n=1 Tax=Ruegeria sp. YS9 TaxID=2966453 RepID=UPI00214C1D15|nr:hypothetical protein [Ruegeria sp. YS9]UUV08275.1 hypothetical protein NOR97_17075 [Ruegeria sp. YS9]
MTKPIISGPYRTFRALNDYESYVEFEGSTITIPLRARRSPNEEWMSDEIKLRAFMRLEVYPPYVNNLGTREFQFTIRDWDLYGKSPMLNQLFYGDPRGRLVTDKETGLSDYVPAAMTFRVSPNNRLKVDPDSPQEARALFGDDSDIELRDLNSHHLRVWHSDPSSGERAQKYSNPHNKIYWEIVSAESLSKEGLSNLLPGGSEGTLFILFHKKHPNIPGDSGEFDLKNPEDRARYLVAFSEFESQDEIEAHGRSLSRTRSRLLGRGLGSMVTQLRGNSVISSFSRSKQSLDIRVPINPAFTEKGTLQERATELLKESDAGKIRGEIQFASPSRSLGTADRAPLPGEPFDSADFPARITYAINYDIFVNDQKFVEDQAGIAIAVGAEEIPPRDVKVAFEKPQAGLVADRYLEFSAGSCTGMMEITKEEFEEGMNFSRYWRNVPLAPDALELRSNGGIFEDYNPKKNY